VKDRFNASLNLDIDYLLRQVWVGSATMPQFDESCVLCGNKDVEVHHLRKVGDVRHKNAKYGTGPGGVTFDQWVGAFRRKSIPICKFHHKDLHAGKLTLDQLEVLAKYSGKMGRRAAELKRNVGRSERSERTVS
jgi:hypothetical protein